jgi:Cytochrome c7 and related cytochrome c/Class III cytochrome C family
MQLFSPRAVIGMKVGAIGAVIVVIAAILAWRRSVAPRPAVGAPVDQPVPFSHKHHAGDDGIDCRYCHTSVETSAFAGIPPLSTCMTCHSQLFTDAPLLAPLRASFAGQQTLAWQRVHDLPDFVYFDHSIHIAKGVGCSTCHGAVDTMPLTSRVASLHMQWCLDCHREPERYLRPKSQVFNMKWQAPPDQRVLGKKLRAIYHIHPSSVLTSCSTCHR